MRDKWQALRIVTGVLFLLTAVMIEVYVPHWQYKRITEGLLVFLGIFYIVSSYILKLLFRKFQGGKN
ncbi:MAG: hypothetical protein AB1500_10305 [Bacillota bacterium]